MKSHARGLPDMALVGSNDCGPEFAAHSLYKQQRG